MLTFITALLNMLELIVDELIAQLVNDQKCFGRSLKKIALLSRQDLGKQLNLRTLLIFVFFVTIRNQ